MVLVDEVGSDLIQSVLTLTSFSDTTQFDQINRNIEPYFALSPQTFQARVKDLGSGLPFSFHLSIRNGTLTVGGERSSLSRAEDIRRLVEPFLEWIPNLIMHASDHDKGNIILGQDQYDTALELINEGSCGYTLELEFGYTLTLYTRFHECSIAALRKSRAQFTAWLAKRLRSFFECCS